MTYADAEAIVRWEGPRHLANTWQGEFPWQSFVQDGFEGTSPVGAFPANGYGLHDMIGSVWEWTSDWYVPTHRAEAVKACCIPRNPLGPRLEESYDPAMPDIKIPRKVLKGESHLCAPNYCRRYRPCELTPTTRGHLPNERQFGTARLDASRNHRR